MFDTNKDAERELYTNIGEIKASFDSWKNDHREYRHDIAEFKVTFARLFEEIGLIRDAVTKTAIDMERISQQVRGNTDDIAEDRHHLKKLDDKVEDLDKRIKVVEHGRAAERGAWAAFVIVWTIAGAVGGAFLAVVLPGWIPPWLKGAGQ